MITEHKSLCKFLLDWYSLNNRDLPWRRTKDPFNIWISEIILQQTRVSQGLPYYLKFVERFQNVFEFAAAEEGEILKLWQGLGYYSRARNMHACAKGIVEDYDGKFPENCGELLKLKGIGKYTAAAISSICFDEKVPAIDGNAYRVFSRVFGISDDISHAKTYKVFHDAAFSIMPDQNSGNFNQAVMELGATICSPKNPFCESCPLSSFCLANAKSKQSSFPVKTKKIKIITRNFHFQVIEWKGYILISKRSAKDIWAGLHEFLLADQTPVISGRFIKNSDVLTHQLTHQKLFIQFHSWEVGKIEFDRIKKKFKMTSVHISEIGNFAVPKPIEQFLKSEYLLVN